MTEAEQIAAFMRNKGVQQLPEGDGKTTLTGFQRAVADTEHETVEQAAERRAQQGFEDALRRQGVV